MERIWMGNVAILRIFFQIVYKFGIMSTHAPLCMHGVLVPAPLYMHAWSPGASNSIHACLESWCQLLYTCMPGVLVPATLYMHAWSPGASSSIHACLESWCQFPYSKEKRRRKRWRRWERRRYPLSPTKFHF